MPMGSGLYCMASQVQHSSGIGKEVAACFGEFSTMRDSPEETRLEALFKVSDMAALTLPSERVAHKRTGFGLSSGWR